MNPPTTTSPPAVLPAALRAGLELMAARRLRDPDDIQDAVQETLVRTLAAASEGRIPVTTSVGAYAHGIAAHVIADVHRERGRHSVDPIGPDLADPRPCALAHIVGAEEQGAVRAALSRLEAAERDVLISCFVHGERTAALAARLGIPAERLRKRKSRAIARLRVLLGTQRSPMP